jgi:hypothetical protein
MDLSGSPAQQTEKACHEADIGTHIDNHGSFMDVGLQAIPLGIPPAVAMQVVEDFLFIAIPMVGQPEKSPIHPNGPPGEKKADFKEQPGCRKT